MDLYDVMRTTFAARATSPPSPFPTMCSRADPRQRAFRAEWRQSPGLARDRCARPGQACRSRSADRTHVSTLPGRGRGRREPLEHGGACGSRPVGGGRRHDSGGLHRALGPCADVAPGHGGSLAVVAAMDQHLPRIGVVPGASIYPFVWNILLAARNEGFGGTLTTFLSRRGSAGQAVVRDPREPCGGGDAATG